MSVRLSILILVLIAVPSGARGTGAAVEPDHLLPVRVGYDRFSREYDRRVRRLLQAPDWAEAVVICRPSFDPEECLAIRRAADDPSRLVMTHTRASRNIWQASCGRGHHPRVVTASRRDVPLPADLARRVCRVWNEMLVRARPYAPAGDGEGFGGGDLLPALDDTTFVFERHGMRGETTESTAGEATVRLVRLADALFHHANTGPARRAEALKKVEDACRDLEVYLGLGPADR